MNSIQLKVDGMSCGSCVASVTRVLQQVPGVDAVAVNLAGGVATVSTQDLAATQLPQMLAALAAAGYEASPLAVQEGAAAPITDSPRGAAGGCGQGGAARQTRGGCCCGR